MQNMTEGNVTKRMVSFSIPLLFGNVLQQLYSAAAAVIVGKFAGKMALAAVGTAASGSNGGLQYSVGHPANISLCWYFYFARSREPAWCECNCCL